MTFESVLLRQQDAVTVLYDEDEDCFTIEQQNLMDEEPHRIFVSAWNLPDFMQRLESVYKAYRENAGCPDTGK